MEKMMTEHSIKTVDTYFQAVKAGLKPFEVRRDDRGYQKGDTLLLRRYGDLPNSYGGSAYITPDDKKTGIETGAETIRAEITYILTGGQFGIEPGYVVLGVKVLQ